MKLQFDKILGPYFMGPIEIPKEGVPERKVCFNFDSVALVMLASPDGKNGCSRSEIRAGLKNEFKVFISNECRGMEQVRERALYRFFDMFSEKEESTAFEKLKEKEEE
jgi:hypothetical protein